MAISLFSFNAVVRNHAIMIVNTFRILIVHAHAAETIHHSEVSLKMVAPGAGFRSGTFYRPKNR